MTTYTRMTKKDNAGYSPEQFCGLLLIMTAAVLIGAFAAGILTGMLINRKEYERRDAIRLIHDLEKHGGQME